MVESRALSGDYFRDARMFSTCEQCGLCSSACPITGIDDYNIRRILRFVELGMPDHIAETSFPWQCTTCARCEGVCPNGIAILDIIRPLRAMAREEDIPSLPPCIDACPAGIDIPGYIRLISGEKFQDAFDLIMKSAPFPGILGRVCTHPCETACRRSEVNEPISICALKRFAADAGGEDWKRPLPAADTGRRVAIVGAGPAGLSVAYYLRNKGHRVTILEAREKPGGMMRYGIPSYRLPEEIVEQEIARLLGNDIELRTGIGLGRDFTLDDLKKQGFDAIFLGTGLWESKRISLEGSDLEGVMWGLDFLVGVSEKVPCEMKEKVLVAGGGNVAVDVALTALRLGAGEVTMACLESRSEMPANPWEVEMAIEEGVRVMPSWGPGRILSSGARVAGVELVRCTSVFDEKGSFCPSFDETRQKVDADQVILAIGQKGSVSYLKEVRGLEIENDLVRVDEKSLETGSKGVFAGGDAAHGASNIIQTVASGKKAASSIDRFLGGDGIIEEERGLVEPPDEYTGRRQEGFADLERSECTHLQIEERAGTFAEVESGLSREQALSEAARCLQCDLEIRLAKKISGEIR